MNTKSAQKMAPKLEMNIRSLIVHCEEIAKEDPKNWLLKKYIKSLDTMIKELEDNEEYVQKILMHSRNQKMINFKLQTVNQRRPH